MWDVATRKQVLTLRGHACPVNSVAFSPDGLRIAAAGGDGTVKLWDATRGQEVLTLRGHTAEVHCVAFSPDGHRIASAGADGTVKLWDATPLTAESQLLREAQSVVEFLFLEPRPIAELRRRIRDDLAISSAVRERAWRWRNLGRKVLSRSRPNALCTRFSPDQCSVPTSWQACAPTAP